MEPLASLSRLETVLVMTSFVPVEVDGAVSYYVGLPLLLLVALVEASVLPMFRIGGLQPNLVLVLLVAWLMVRGAGEAFVLIPSAGSSSASSMARHWARRCSPWRPWRCCRRCAAPAARGRPRPDDRLHGRS